MFVKDADWEQIKHQFTQQEKHTIMLARGPESIVPRGVTLNINHFPPDLLAKLNRELRQLEKPTV
jgi:hypothetical protein